MQILDIDQEPGLATGQAALTDRRVENRAPQQLVGDHGVVVPAPRTLDAEEGRNRRETTLCRSFVDAGLAESEALGRFMSSAT
ncbi:hypothetical protein [Solirubrobacter pauli]|uniref:hypothetical protein n=1 Tax=Solirubrobacter pauli TaxID=166793 RepID=UPI0011C48F29|nr:hypothetical protein [Solirubrobacter pauli]